jgi:hypothetical protein
MPALEFVWWCGMVTLPPVFYRSPFLRLAARALVFVIVGVPLLRLALTIQSSVGHLSAIGTILLLAGFCYLEAVVLVLATGMFKKVP